MYVKLVAHFNKGRNRNSFLILGKHSSGKWKLSKVMTSSSDSKVIQILTAGKRLQHFL